MELGVRDRGVGSPALGRTHFLGADGSRVQRHHLPCLSLYGHSSHHGAPLLIPPRGLISKHFRGQSFDLGTWGARFSPQHYALEVFRGAPTDTGPLGAVALRVLPGVAHASSVWLAWALGVPFWTSRTVSPPTAPVLGSSLSVRSTRQLGPTQPAHVSVFTAMSPREGTREMLGTRFLVARRNNRTQEKRVTFLQTTAGPHGCPQAHRPAAAGESAARTLWARPHLITSLCL